MINNEIVQLIFMTTLRRPSCQSLLDLVALSVNRLRQIVCRNRLLSYLTMAAEFSKAPGCCDAS